jgi:ATP-dependent DNA ligase
VEFPEMSDVLSNYLSDNYCKAVKMDLSEWLILNPLPAIVEEKYDGIRVFLFKSGDKLVVSSKNGVMFTPKGNPKVFAMVPEFTHAPYRMILDGEYVSDEGLHFFDIIQVDDKDLRSLVLEERKKVLSEILGGTGLESPSRHAKSLSEIQEIFNKIVSEGGEGALCKNPLSIYGQPNSWVKLKRYDTIDCFVTDYEETPEMKRSGVPRSWFIGLYDDDSGTIVNIGKVGSFIEKIDPRDVKLGSVIEIRFQEVTRDKKLRAPYIIRIRHDKSADECLLSQLR